MSRLCYPPLFTSSLFHHSVSGYAFSEDGEHLAYGVSASGSDWVEIRFLRVDGAVALEDRLERVKFSCMAWTHDGKGLFYNSYPEQEGKSDGVHARLTSDFIKKNPNHLLFYCVQICCTKTGKSLSVSGTETSTNLNQKLYYHVLGTPQSRDTLCAEFPDQPKWMSGAEVTHTHCPSTDHTHVITSMQTGCVIFFFFFSPSRYVVGF